MNPRFRCTLFYALIVTLPSLSCALDAPVSGQAAGNAITGASLHNGVQLQGPGLVVQGRVLQGPGVVLQGPVLQGPGLVLQGRVLQGPGVVLQGPVLQGPGLIVQGIELRGSGLLQQNVVPSTDGADPVPLIALQGRPWPSVPTGPFAAIPSAEVRVRVSPSR